MKTANLTGALLDYWVARAEGIPADQLEIRQVPRTDVLICVREWCTDTSGTAVVALAYSTKWDLGGPLIEKHVIGLDICHGGVGAYVRHRQAPCDGDQAYGDTPLQAVCRAVAHAAFGDEVEDVPC